MFLNRRHLLYVLLAALAVAGFSGVAAIFLNSSGYVWRVAGTGLIAAIAAGLMMPASVWADRPATRIAGLVGMSLCVLELSLCAVLVWGNLLPNSFWEFAAGVAGALAGSGLVALCFLLRLRAAGWGLASLFGVAGCAIACFLWIASAFDGSFAGGTTAEELFTSGMAVICSGVLGSFTLVGLERSDRRVWRWIGTAAAVVGLAMVLYGTWIREGGEPAWVVGAYALSAVIGHAIAALRSRLTRAQEPVRWVAIASAAATGMLVVTAVYADSNWSLLDTFGHVWRLTVATGIVCACASMALIVFGRLNRRPVVELAKVAFDRVTLFCPRCERKITVPTGGGLCEGCKLHIHITLQSSRCATCGYDLTNLKADRCPECGTNLPVATAGLTETTG